MSLVPRSVDHLVRRGLSRVHHKLWIYIKLAINDDELFGCHRRTGASEKTPVLTGPRFCPSQVKLKYKELVLTKSATELKTQIVSFGKLHPSIKASPHRREIFAPVANVSLRKVATGSVYIAVYECAHTDANVSPDVCESAALKFRFAACANEAGIAVTVNSVRYVEMIQNFFTPRLAHFPVNENTLFQQDGATSHTARISKDSLNVLFPGHVISRPPRSPDLTVCDFFLWGHLKIKVLGRNPPITIPALKQRMREEVAAIPVNMLRGVMQQFVARLEECVRFNGGHLADVILKNFFLVAYLMVIHVLVIFTH
ncbi:hypothetical protein ANN_22143 [Periplaneta americana]|uniref:Uncharacterized protein n=1 Tax=Periplaneta americana TaxID=6978 RepID=A0ABQ8S7B0_PERAM|nr:hypothetical protein ANN_22143 [Periplaneta americana]